MVQLISWFSSDILEGELDAELDTEWLLLADDPRPLLFPLPFSILSGVTEIKKKYFKASDKTLKNEQLCMVSLHRIHHLFLYYTSHYYNLLILFNCNILPNVFIMRNKRLVAIGAQVTRY